MAAEVQPAFVLQSNSSVVWARMQAGTTSTADLQALQASASGILHAARLQEAGRLMDALLQVQPLRFSAFQSSAPRPLRHFCILREASVGKKLPVRQREPPEQPWGRWGSPRRLCCFTWTLLLLHRCDACMQVASWSLGREPPMATAELREGCEKVLEVLQPLLPASDTPLDTASVLEAEVSALEGELLQLGLDLKETPLDLEPLATFFQYARSHLAAPLQRPRGCCPGC